MNGLSTGYMIPSSHVILKDTSIYEEKASLPGTLPLRRDPVVWSMRTCWVFAWSSSSEILCRLACGDMANAVNPLPGWRLLR
jgi:hypothetical protein